MSGAPYAIDSIINKAQERTGFTREPGAAGLHGRLVSFTPIVIQLCSDLSMNQSVFGYPLE